LGNGGAQVFLEIPRLVVHDGVEAELVAHVIALGLAARDADDAATGDLAELADDAPDRARGGGDDESIALLRLADFVQAEPGREAGHAEDPEVIRSGHPRSVHLV